MAALLAVLGLRRAAPSSRLPAILIGCYLAVGVGLFLLPNRTGPYHWVIGTPFQYLALAMALMRPARPPIRLPRLAVVCRAALMGAIGVLMIGRAQGTLDLVDAFNRGASSQDWDPSLTRLGELVAKRAGHNRFIAGNWGVATQMYCLADGDPELVRELFWETTPRLETSLDPDRFHFFYLILKVPQAFPDPILTQRLISAFERHPNLREVPVEGDFARLAAIQVREFEHCRRP
jgi:hypothetical protein